MLQLSQQAARDLLLAAQGLTRAPERPATKADVLAAIQRMGALQIDTISVVARSPYFVLWSRLGDYDQAWLDELLAEGALFEYWAHAACFLPIEHYPYFRRLMLERLKGGAARHDWLVQNAAEAERILAHVRERGPVRSIELGARSEPGSGWWDWKPEKVALECLHTAGELMTARRHNFQRVYDLRERVLPYWTDEQSPSLAETWRHFALATVRCLGVAPAAWVPDYFRTPKTGASKVLAVLAGEGALLQAQVEGWETPGYIHPDNRKLTEAAAAGNLRSEVTTLLTPFDPIVWDRARGRSLFGFDYTIECYTPAPKRRYGYFTLPILHRGTLAGRIDAKAHRKERRFEVKALHLEPGVEPSPALVQDLAAALRACAAWHRTPAVTVLHSDPPEVAALINAQLSGSPAIWRVLRDIRACRSCRNCGYPLSEGLIASSEW